MCYSWNTNLSESLEMNSSSSSLNKRGLETNDEEINSKRISSPNKTETRSMSRLNNESSPATSSKLQVVPDDGWTFSEETLYRVLKKIYDYNSCALARFIRTKTCSQIREHIKKVIK